MSEVTRPISGRPRGAVPFAPEGWPFIIPMLLFTLAAWALGKQIAAPVLMLILLFTLNFFRDPERATPAGDGLYIAPADGKVIRAEATETGYRVDIFMNVFNVHVNRAPMAGRIDRVIYTKGKFVNAADLNASNVNERCRYEMTNSAGEKLAFTQISGLIARRIVGYAEAEAEVNAGERIGMIRFGSRVDCEIPAGFELKVKVGDKVSAGLTVLAARNA